MSDGEHRQIPCARAKFDFEAKSDVELSFSAGMSVRLLRRIDDNWLEGELEGKVGIFPAAYVDIELSMPSKSQENELAKSGRPYAVGLFEFGGDCEGDLSFGKGELIELTGSAGSGWIRGKTRGREGIFPASFVEILKLPSTSDSDSSCPATPVHPGPRDRQSPEYALPGELPLRAAVTSPATPEREGEGVFENGFSDDDDDEELQPVPTPRRGRTSRSKGSSSAGEEGEKAEREMPSHTPPPPSLHLDPDASPPPNRQLFPSATMPRPKPRSRLVRNTSLSTFQTQVNTLQGLAVEKKLLHSARNLLQISHDETKQEKLKVSITTHESNIKSLKQQLRALKAQQESVSESGAATPPLRPSSPPRQQLPPPQPPSMKQQRAKVIEELITTETDYYNQMLACCDKLIPAMEEIGEINSELLFGNLDEVTCVSHDLMTSLRDTCQTEEKVAGVFVKFGPRLRTAYAAYCRNHDTASALVEKYMESPDLAKKIKGTLDAIKAEVQAWDLQSLLIKPVQRVLKYPLLLDKLIHTTGDDHPDYKHIHIAREVIGQVAQDINEIKRRKDLVERYTGAGREERRGTLTVHSLQKKVRRFQQTLTQLTGLRSKTVDPKFEELEQKLTSLEMFLRQLIRNTTTWQEDIQKAVDSREVLGEGMSLYVTADMRTLTSYQRWVTELQQAVKSHGGAVNTHVLVPFQSLVALFQNPLHLISKRRDKLLDFDHLQYALDHNTEDPEKIRQLRDACTMAKRNYEALNEQLIEELPHFIQLAQNMINHTVIVLVQLQYRFHTAVHAILERIADMTQTDNGLLSSEVLQEAHGKAVAEVAGQLISLSIVPTSLAINYSLPARSSHRSSSETGSAGSGVQVEGEREDSVLSTSSEVDMDSSIAEEPSEMSTAPLLGTELTVLYDFEAQDKAELSVCAGQTVTLRCPSDRIGCPEWWLVECPHGTGYVPANFLDYHGNT